MPVVIPFKSMAQAVFDKTDPIYPEALQSDG